MPRPSKDAACIDRTDFTRMPLMKIQQAILRTC